MADSPRVRYTEQQQDGSKIAFWVVGDGPPLIHLPFLPASHVGLEWYLPVLRDWYRRLALDWTLIRFDPHAFGLSKNPSTEFSLNSFAADIDTLADYLGLDQFALFGPFTSGQLAIAYAAYHPERVTYLYSWYSWRRAGLPPESANAFQKFASMDWKLHRDTFAEAALGPVDRELLEQWSELIGESVEQATWQQAIGELSEFDVSDLLQYVTSPTFIMHRRQRAAWPTAHEAEKLANGIRSANLKLFRGQSPAPFMSDVADVDDPVDGPEEVASELEKFRDQVDRETSLLGVNELVTILFSDIENSTGKTVRLGDAGAQEFLREHNRIVQRLITDYGGDVIKGTGDGFLATFRSNVQALDCATEIQKRVANYNKNAVGEPFRVRIGMNAGEPIREEHDIHGQPVQLAARIRDAANPGQILVSIKVVEVAEGKDFEFTERDTLSPKGFPAPVRVFELTWEEKVDKPAIASAGRVGDP